jgi:histidinol dehydrogenase
MPLASLDVRGLDPEELERALPRPTAAPGGRGDDPQGDRVAQRVAEILDKVRTEGDMALIELTTLLDGVAEPVLTVPEGDLRRAAEEIPQALLQSLEFAWERVVAFHRHQAGGQLTTFDDGVVLIDELVRPVARAGLYAPGGRAFYPSSVLMCAAPAQVAGVGELALCIPPGSDGRVPAAALAAAHVAGITEVHPIGGAQAIAAMAFGTSSVRRVDVVVGPGNRYVAEAKRQVAGSVGVAAAFAGPSEVVVVADGSSPVEWAAIDLVVQAEHGPDGLAFLVTWSEDLVGQVSEAVDRMVEVSSRRSELLETIGSGGFAVLVEGPEQAITVANIIAPEHLELQVNDARRLADQVRSAGVVFVGPWAPASVGDYVAGTNHVLPTARTARFSQALRVDDFRTHIGVVSVNRQGLEKLAPHVVEIALAEGLEAHAGSVGLRFDDSSRSASDVEWVGHDSGARLPEMRSDLVAMKGYHSAQVEVAVRLNVNESPYPPPASWLSELKEQLDLIGFNRYPDRSAWQLREAIAAHEGVEPDQVFCANGSNEVLQSILLAYGGSGRSVAVFEPTYALHRHIAMLTATTVHTGWREDDLTLAADVVDRVVEEWSPVVTFLCSPNNPTGRTEPEELIAHVLSTVPGLVVVDEAYGQFSGRSAIDLARDKTPGYERLVVARTFSKTWSMAACRLGYLVAHPEVVSACEAVVLPYHLDAITQAAGVLALRHEREMRERVASIVSERKRLATAMAELDVQMWPSDANFILFRPLHRDAGQVWSELLDRQVLIRDCSGWPGLTGCLRVTIGTPEENDMFIGALSESLDKTGRPL